MGRIRRRERAAFDPEGDNMLLDQVAEDVYCMDMAHEQILVVDDDREIVRMVRGYLEQSGYEVLSAYDGE